MKLDEPEQKVQRLVPFYVPTAQQADWIAVQPRVLHGIDFVSFGRSEQFTSVQESQRVEN